MTPAQVAQQQQSDYMTLHFDLEAIKTKLMELAGGVKAANEAITYVYDADHELSEKGQAPVMRTLFDHATRLGMAASLNSLHPQISRMLILVEEGQKHCVELCPALQSAGTAIN